MTEVETLIQHRSEAIAARHRVMVGERVVILAYSTAGGNNQKQFDRVNLRELNSYISWLDSEIARLGGGQARRRIRYI